MSDPFHTPPPLDRERFLDDLRTLVGFRTVVLRNKGEFLKATDWIRSFFDPSRTTFLEFECHGLVSIIIKPSDSERPNVLGDGHIEVVPAEDRLFTVQERGGLLYGRGVADMKTQCLMMMYVLRELIASGEHNDLWLLLSQDEEKGSEHGVALVSERLQTHGLFPRVVFAPDGGPDFAYVEKEKGLVGFSVVVRGRAAHGSRPFLGDNAIDKTTALYERLKAAFPNPRNEDDWVHSLSMTTIAAGEAQNQIPDTCRASFDVRITELERPEVVADQIRLIARDFGADVTFDAMEPAAYYPREWPVAHRFLEILREETGRQPRILHAAGASNGRLYQQSAPQVPVLMSGPRVGGSHGPDEWLDPESLDTYHRIVWRTALLQTPIP